MADLDLTALREIADPLERLREAHRVGGEVDKIRDEALAEGRQNGLSLPTLGDAIELSGERVRQILKGKPGPERAFLGADRKQLTACFGRKKEADAEPGSAGRVWAEEDAVAFDLLQDMGSDLGLTTARELISPPGFIDLNRPGLVVICGPRLSPMVAQVLASDRALAFGHDDAGWHIRDRRAGVTWHSPMNTSENADIAYMGRLERPDRQGTFLYLAGIHAPGAPGAVHYLAENLEHVWQRVRDRGFSVLIRSTFEYDPFRVTGSLLLTDFYEGN